MNEYVLKISRAVREAGGRAMLVGGCVRDQWFGVDAKSGVREEVKDFDLEVYYLEPARLRSVLQSLGRVNTVGEQFAVYKLAFNPDADEPASDDRHPAGRKSGRQARFEIDVSIPRRESKSGAGHRGFVITGDPFMSFADAARRRDFTINAILQDPLTGDLIDPFNGVADLRARVLRVVAPETFVEDSLRVLRAVQFAARFEMTVEAQTIALCRSITLSDLPHERIWNEVEKWLLAARPSIGLQTALELGVLDQLFPQLRALLDRQLESERPGDLQTDSQNAFERTRRRLDEAAVLTTDLAKERRLAVMLAALCLDVEPTPAGGPEPARAILDRLGLYTVAGYDVRDQVLKLVREGQQPRRFYARQQETRDGDFRRLARRVDMNLLYRLARADRQARGLASGDAEEWFLERTRALGVEGGPPAPLLLGRHLLEMGCEPGKQMGEILRLVYELQLDGSVTSLEEARSAAQSLRHP